MLYDWKEAVYRGQAIDSVILPWTKETARGDLFLPASETSIAAVRTSSRTSGHAGGARESTAIFVIRGELDGTTKADVQ